MRDIEHTVEEAQTFCTLTLHSVFCRQQPLKTTSYNQL